METTKQCLQKCRYWYIIIKNSRENEKTGAVIVFLTQIQMYKRTTCKCSITNINNETKINIKTLNDEKTNLINDATY